MVNVPTPPEADMDADKLDGLNTGTTMPDVGWTIDKVITFDPLETLIHPLLELDVVFAVKENDTLPLPLPLLGERFVIHVPDLVTVHEVLQAMSKLSLCAFPLLYVQVRSPVVPSTVRYELDAD